MVKTKIILRPEKEVLDSYFNTNTANYKFSDSTKLYPSEAMALGAIAEAYHPNTIIRIPEVLYPLETKTPDFLIDEIEYEVKAPIAFSGISALAKKSETQLRSPTGYLVMELMNIKTSLFTPCSNGHTSIFQSAISKTSLSCATAIFSTPPTPNRDFAKLMLPFFEKITILFS